MSRRERAERLSIIKLLREGGYLLKVPREGTAKAKPEVEEEVLTPKPGAPAEPRPVEKASEDVRSRLELLLPKVIRELREKYGDVILLSDFLAMVADEYEAKYGEGEISVDDVLQAISDLAEKGVICGTLSLESGVKIIRLSPEGFGKDELKVMEIVSTMTPPQITLEELVAKTKWPMAKARAVLEALERARVARRIPGSYTGRQDAWYFPGLEKKLK